MIAPVPKVDGRPSDLENIIGVIMNKKKKLNVLEIETKHGLLKRWFRLNNSPMTMSNLIAID